MLTARELTDMRAVQAQALPSVATVTRRALATDNAGGFSETITTVAHDCRVSAARIGDGDLIGGQVSEKPLYRITFAAGADVRNTDKITVGSRAFEVLGVLAGGSWETALVCICGVR